MWIMEMRAVEETDEDGEDRRKWKWMILFSDSKQEQKKNKGKEKEEEEEKKHLGEATWLLLLIFMAWGLCRLLMYCVCVLIYIRKCGSEVICGE